MITRRHRAERRAVELNITAFMNLMVVLVPFLLITAVFSRMAVLELNLPAEAAAAADAEEPKLELEIVLREESLTVRDARGGLIQRLPVTESGHDLAGLSGILQQIKERYPDKTDAMLLVAPAVSYDVLVQVMDTVRVGTSAGAGAETTELFPEISIGDAPLQGELMTRAKR